MTGCRIGKIKFKSGVEMRLLPDAHQRQAKKALVDLNRSIGHVKRLYNSNLDGFVVIAWDWDGNWNTFAHCGRGYVGKNTLPQFTSEAVRRDVCEDDSRSLIQRILRNE